VAQLAASEAAGAKRTVLKSSVMAFGPVRL
jgi:hypothetical protein